MNILFIDKPDLALAYENKTIRVDDKKIPLRLVDTIVLASDVALTSRTLLKIASEGVNIILYNAHSHSNAIVLNGNAKNSELKSAQYQALANRLEIAKYFLTQKLLRHAAHLHAHEIIIETKEALEHCVAANEIESLLGIEGSFSRAYFGHYFDLIPQKFHSGKRTKQPPLDPANALLSYLYSMLYAILSTKLLSHGFELGIGYLHTPFRSHNALASDMMELFRHDINEAVVILFKEELVCINDFYKKEGVYLNTEGKKKLYTPIKELWEGLEPKIASEIASLRSLLCKTNENH